MDANGEDLLNVGTYEWMKYLLFYYLPFLYLIASMTSQNSFKRIRYGLFEFLIVVKVLLFSTSLFLYLGSVYDLTLVGQ